MMNRGSLPPGYALRPAAPGDLPDVLALIQARELEGYGETGMTAGRLRLAWQAPGFLLETDAWAVISPQGELAAYAEARPHPAPPRCRPSVYVAPQHARRGLGAYLLCLAEERACLGCPSPAEIVLTCIASAHPAGMRLLEHAGYCLELTFNFMEIDLAEPPAASRWPPGIAVCPFRPGLDDEAVYRADEEASEDKGYHTPLAYAAWAERMGRNSPAFDPGLWFVAWDGEAAAGVALNLLAADTCTGWVDHLGVRRAWRGRGLGTALLLHSFGEFHRRGVRRVRLSVDAHSLTHAPRLYERAGMRTINAYHIYQKRFPG